jgi:cytochrome P450
MTNDPELAKIGAQAKAELGEAIRGQIARAERGDVSAGGAIASFVAAGASTEDIINNVRLMISGGINEPRDGIGLVTWVMLANPDLKDIALGSARGMRRLIEEVFRRYSPVGTITRQATQDTELGGVAIPKGDLVSGVLRSVNLDESHWRDPFSIDLERREGSHAAFALGVHRCLGEWLGRQEVKVGVERLFARFPDLSLEPGHDVTLVGFEFRGPTQLRVCV